MQLLEKAGQLYLKDHAADIEEMSRYLPHDAQASVGGVEAATEASMKQKQSGGIAECSAYIQGH